MESNGSRGTRRLTPAEGFVTWIESLGLLDRPAKAIATRVRATLSPGAIKDAISGVWLGHPAHPLLTDLVIGSWVSATLLDLLPGDGREAASERLIGVGVAASIPTALSGLSDWADAEPADDGVRRSGAVHAGANVAALALYCASLAARRRGAHRHGRLLGLSGAGALTVGGYLGAHLSYAKGVGADQTLFDSGPREWRPVGDRDRFADREPVRVVVDDTPVLVVAIDGEIHAIHDRCAHRGCSLSEGTIGEGEITCACHGSRYALRDGALRRGPATAPQPAFAVRERAETVEIRRDLP